MRAIKVSHAKLFFFLPRRRRHTRDSEITPDTKRQEKEGHVEHQHSNRRSFPPPPTAKSRSQKRKKTLPIVFQNAPRRNTAARRKEIDQRTHDGQKKKARRLEYVQLDRAEQQLHWKRDHSSLLLLFNHTHRHITLLQRYLVPSCHSAVVPKCPSHLDTKRHGRQKSKRKMDLPD